MMAVETWVFWTAIIFMSIIGSMITLFLAWFVHMRATGNWGGGKEVIDFSAYPEGGISKWRIYKKGPLYVHPAGGDQGIVLRTMGLMKKEAVKVKRSDMIPAGDVFFYGRKGVEKAFNVHLKNLDQINAQLRNRLSQVNNELQRKDHDIEEIIDENTKVLAKISRAVFTNYGGGKKK